MNKASIALNRFGLGTRPDEPPPGDPQAWLAGQPAAWQPLPATWAALQRTGPLVDALAAQQRKVRDTPEGQRAALQQALRRDARDDYLAAVAVRAAEALQTATPFAERLTHFWSNHFAVSVDKLSVIGLAGAFEADAIRPHINGRFETLLQAAVRHPAMLLYLDQPQSIGPDSQAGRRLA